MNKFRSAGQVCLCANRTLVHSSVIDRFAELLLKKIGELKFGHGLEPGESFLMLHT
jgi:succinate-semialdehyde dehydrogenase/glutarate-semialdehyde dehydrogenase